MQKCSKITYSGEMREDRQNSHVINKAGKQ